MSYLLRFHQFVAFPVASGRELRPEQTSQVLDLRWSTGGCDGRVSGLERGGHLLRKKEHGDEHEIDDVADRQFSNEVGSGDIDRCLMMWMR